MDEPSIVLSEAEVRIGHFLFFLDVGIGCLNGCWAVVLVEFGSEWNKVEEDCRSALKLDSNSVKVSLHLSFPPSVIFLCNVIPIL